MDALVQQLQEAVERIHEGRASFLEACHVKEGFNGEVVWEGIVHVFRLTGNADADIAYAWSSPIKGSSKRRFFAVLGVPPINSAQDAVKAVNRARIPESQKDS